MAEHIEHLWARASRISFLVKALILRQSDFPPLLSVHLDFKVQVLRPSVKWRFLKDGGAPSHHGFQHVSKVQRCPNMSYLGVAKREVPFEESSSDELLQFTRVFHCPPDDSFHRFRGRVAQHGSTTKQFNVVQQTSPNCSETGGLLSLATINIAETSEERWSWVARKWQFTRFFPSGQMWQFTGRCGNCLDLKKRRCFSWFRPHLATVSVWKNSTTQSPFIKLILPIN